MFVFVGTMHSLFCVKIRSNFPFSCNNLNSSIIPFPTHHVSYENVLFDLDRPCIAQQGSKPEKHAPEEVMRRSRLHVPS
jgi:hypothetical protein